MRRLIPDKDLDLAIHPITIDHTQATPETLFPLFYEEFRTKYRRTYSPQGQYSDSETIPAEVTSQMSLIVAGVNNVPTVSCSRTAMLGDHRQLQRRPQPKCVTSGSHLKSRRLNPATEKPPSALVKRRNAPEKLRNGPRNLADAFQNLMSGRSDQGRSPPESKMRAEGICRPKLAREKLL